MKTQVAIVGSGPAGLMAASQLMGQGIGVTLLEKRPAPGRKILIAGASGLNITHDGEVSSFLPKYTGPQVHWRAVLEHFGPKDWIRFVEALGLETFLGTSRRYFVKNPDQKMKASGLLQAWVQKLKAEGVTFECGAEVLDFEEINHRIVLEIQSSKERTQKKFDAVCFCCGGGSWADKNYPVTWPELFLKKGLRVQPFQSANVGYGVAWKPEFLAETLRKPIKNIVFKSSRGEMAGELMITEYGLEGTPVYTLGETGRVVLDLKPQWTFEEILTRLKGVRENLAPLRRAQKVLGLSEVALALLFHHGTKGDRRSDEDLEGFARQVKEFQIQFLGPRPLEEAISSRGGVDWDDIESNLSLRGLPRVFVAGEMIDWEAPTGGFLIQGCVSQGAWVAARVLETVKPVMAE